MAVTLAAFPLPQHSHAMFMTTHIRCCTPALTAHECNPTATGVPRMPGPAPSTADDPGPGTWQPNVHNTRVRCVQLTRFHETHRCQGTECRQKVAEVSLRSPGLSVSFSQYRIHRQEVVQGPDGATAALAGSQHVGYAAC